jgi:hypothetical protein
MPKYKVLVERQTIDYLETKIEADTEDAARGKAIEFAAENLDMLQASDWVGDLEVINIDLIEE